MKTYQIKQARKKRMSSLAAATFTVSIILIMIAASLSSFTMDEISDRLFRQFGLTTPQAEQKICNSILGGYLDAQGVSAAKNIARENRTAISLELLAYTRKYVAGEAFKQAYEDMRMQYRPIRPIIQTPDEMRAEMIRLCKSSVEKNEASLKQADASLKPLFESVLAASKQMLADAEDPANKQMAAYAQNYEQMLRMQEQAHQQQVRNWEMKYPADPMQYVKKQLQLFLEETKDIDFSAELMEKNKKMVFVNPAYEAKGTRWKMAYRAGKEVIEPTREYVQQWISQLE